MEGASVDDVDVSRERKRKAIVLRDNSQHRAQNRLLDRPHAGG